tara:strand:- start:1805 stop:2932 length:1128 start_codon:yes stop_codon:yes gene_type:complete
MPMTKRKKKKIPSRARSGIGAAPYDKGIDPVLNYFHFEVERKDLISAIKTYVKTNQSKDNVKYINACPEYKFWNATHHCGTAAYLTHTNEMNDRVLYWKNALHNYIDQLVEIGKKLYFEKQAIAKDSANVVSLSPMERLQRKVSATIMQDLLDLEDGWIAGERSYIDLYALFKKHGLSASATAAVREIVEGWLLDYEDAYHKRCPDAVEGYSHLKRPELNYRIKACQAMLSDLDRLKSAAKAIRKTKVKGPKAADKQVARVQYKPEDNDFKLVSIPPIQIVGKLRLYAFNTKSRMLTEYVTSATNGFEVSGTSIKNFDKVSSRTIKLRKPDDFLPIVLNKTPNQINKEWSTLTTKGSVPNGRLNKDTILLRTLDK